MQVLESLLFGCCIAVPFTLLPFSTTFISLSIYFYAIALLFGGYYMYRESFTSY